ncbi:NYN domain-containing protein [Streptomyces sp. NRRL S-495]|uniref:NYN domain-containing protein n=1 Tax=Streptomyces sp. NRRL S-495 TaxID=1609133 RepID=UPI0005F934DB|nr:NYN domain-containing protein [Streptomyces sp. NRRL S-495]KJY39246.1 NYN domain containing protein [Streptomyces sp. NRRL S-495]
MDRCVVLVDAGYLLGAAASLLAGDPSRSKVTVDHIALIAALRERAEAETGLPLLRIYWFDAAPERRPMPEHRRLRVLPRVTVRLGALTRAEGRWVQKGVDAAMLITGDGDLLPGMMSAKEHGVVVHLWALQAADGDFNQSEDLVGEADERRVLDREWIEGSFSLRDTASVFPAPGARHDIAKILAAPPAAPPTGLPGPLPAEPAPGRPAAGVPAAAVATAVAAGPAVDGRPQPAATAVGLKVVPTPKDLAGRSADRQATAADRHQTGPVLRWSSDRGWIERPAQEPAVTAGDGLPTLAQLTTAEQRWADREEDITSIGGDAHEVGQVFARRWTTRAGDVERLTVLWPDYPRIPHRVDGELLRYAARFGLLAHKDDQIDEHDRYAIRAGFWKELAARVPGGNLVVVDD